MFEDEDIYYQKYLKYKNKYLAEAAEMDGGKRSDAAIQRREKIRQLRKEHGKDYNPKVHAPEHIQRDHTPQKKARIDEREAIKKTIKYSPGLPHSESGSTQSESTQSRRARRKESPVRQFKIAGDLNTKSTRRVEEIKKK